MLLLISMMRITMIKIMFLLLNFPPVKFGNASYTLYIYIYLMIRDVYTNGIYLLKKKRPSLTRKIQTKAHSYKHKHK